jgi:hypothetical protein
MAELSAQPLARSSGVPGKAGKGSRSQRKGEAQQATAAGLDLLRVLGWLVLHEAAVPGDPEGTIDHVLAGPSGVYVVNTVTWSGAINMRSDVLNVGGTNRSEALTQVAAAADAVRALLGGVPVAPMLCFERLEPVAGVVGDVALCASENILDLLTGQPHLLSSAAFAQASRTIAIACRAGARPASPKVEVGRAKAAPAPKDAKNGKARAEVPPPPPPRPAVVPPAQPTEEVVARRAQEAPAAAVASAEDIARVAAFERLMAGGSDKHVPTTDSLAGPVVGPVAEDLVEGPVVDLVEDLVADPVQDEPVGDLAATLPQAVIGDAGAALWRELTGSPEEGRTATAESAEVAELVDIDAALAEAEAWEREVEEAALREREAREARELTERLAAEAAAQERAEQEAREAREYDAEERAAQEARERKAREAFERVEREARELAKQEELELAEREARARADREARDAAAREAAERAEREARERAEQAAREAAERAEQAAREAAELAEREAAEREAAERAEQEAREAAELAEQAARDAAELAEQEARERAEQEAREAAELAEREAAERAEQEAREAAELAEREAAERAEQEAREAAELAEREAAERAEQEAREAAELAEREAAERAEQEAREAAELAEQEARERAEQEAREAVELAEREAAEPPALDTRTEPETVVEAEVEDLAIEDLAIDELDLEDLAIDELNVEDLTEDADTEVEDDDDADDLDPEQLARERAAWEALKQAAREAREREQRENEAAWTRQLEAHQARLRAEEEARLLWLGPPEPEKAEPDKVDEPAEALSGRGRHLPRRAFVNVAVGALLIAVVAVVVPRVPGAVSWAQQLVGKDQPTTVGALVSVDATAEHPDVHVLAGLPVDARPGSGARVPKGQHLVAVPVRLENLGLTRWDVPLATRMTVVDDLGVSEKIARGVSSVKGLPLLGAQVKVAPGKVVTGYVVFSVPTARTISSVRLALGQSRGDAVTWRVR